MRRLGLVIAGICLLAAPYAARAAQDPACLARAIADKKVCKAQCVDDFNTAKFVCKGIDPACGNPCLAGRISCVDKVKEPLEACIADCQAILEANKLTCAPPPPCDGNADCIACVGGFQADALKCRLRCKAEFFGNTANQAALIACKLGFRSCVQACN